jgi:small conductance mechanosensitive channel
MLVFFRPFRVGDMIQAAGVSGIVETIGIFSTVVKTPDNVVITVPNSLIYAGAITNFTAEPTRRIDIAVAISYEDSIAEAKKLLREVLNADRRVLVAPAPEIAVSDLGQNAVSIAVRAWTSTADLAATRADLLERIKETLEQRGLGIPYPRMRLERRAPKPAGVE